MVLITLLGVFTVQSDEFRAGFVKTQNFQEMFLTNFRLFGAGPDSLRDVLKLLLRRFTLSENTNDPTFRVEDRVPIRHE